MARAPYHIARQEHLGDALNDLAVRGVLRWRWDYAGRRAIFHIAVRSEPERALDTKAAEQLVSAFYADLGVPWLPVPYPGGKEQRATTVREIERLRGAGGES